ncbi:MAG: hypothetical protein M0027_10445 [Candidatus Dormibacteraeota bacterium]|jgi:hypothetical protein|nr:hypothetical protein [Candidatus Dormibacteraeota bacterium]
MELTVDTYSSVTNEAALGLATRDPLIFSTDRIERMLYGPVAWAPVFRWSAFDPAAPSVRRFRLDLDALG